MIKDEIIQHITKDVKVEELEARFDPNEEQKCPSCSKTLTSDDLELHFLYCKEKPICDVCDKHFTTFKELHSHFIKEHRKYECDICVRSFYSNQSLGQHKTAVHINKNLSNVNFVAVVLILNKH